MAWQVRLLVGKSVITYIIKRHEIEKNDQRIRLKSVSAK